MVEEFESQLNKRKEQKNGKLVKSTRKEILLLLRETKDATEELKAESRKYLIDTMPYFDYINAFVFHARDVVNLCQYMLSAAIDRVHRLFIVTPAFQHSGPYETREEKRLRKTQERREILDNNKEKRDIEKEHRRLGELRAQERLQLLESTLQKDKIKKVNFMLNSHFHNV